MSDALAVDELRKDAAEKERKDEEGDEETGNLADGGHHGDDWDDEKTILVKKFARREGNIVANESGHVTSVTFASYEGSFESFAPGMATNEKEYNREGGANLEEEEATAKERDVSCKVFNKVGVDNIRKNREEGGRNRKACNGEVWRRTLFLACTAEDDNEDSGHNNSETNTLHGRDVFTKDSDAETERDERAELAEDIYISRVTGLKRFEIIDRADHVNDPGENKTAGIIERQNEDGTTKDGEQDKHRHNEAWQAAQNEGAGAFFRQRNIGEVVFEIATADIEKIRENREDCPQHVSIIL